MPDHLARLAGIDRAHGAVGDLERRAPAAGDVGGEHSGVDQKDGAAEADANAPILLDRVTDDEMLDAPSRQEPRHLGVALGVAPLAEAPKPEGAVGGIDRPVAPVEKALVDLAPLRVPGRRRVTLSGLLGGRTGGGLGSGERHELFLDRASRLLQIEERQGQSLRDEELPVGIEGCQIFVHAPVDGLERSSRESRREAAVQKRGPPREKVRGPGAQPAAVCAAGTERLAVLDHARRVSLEPGLPRFAPGGRLGLPELPGTPLAQIPNLEPGVLTALLRPGVRELGVVRESDVAQIAGHVHDLVVSEQRHHAPATLDGRLLQRHDEIERASHARAAVDQVTDLDQHGLAAHPGAGRFENAGLHENLLERCEVTVDIADRHDARRCGCGRRGKAESKAVSEADPEPPPTVEESDPDFTHHEDSTEWFPVPVVRGGRRRVHRAVFSPRPFSG